MHSADESQLNPELASLRVSIDEIDGKILELLAERFRVASRVAVLKATIGLAARLDGRIKTVRASREARGRALLMPVGAADRIWAAIIEETCRHEENLMAWDKTATAAEG